MFKQLTYPKFGKVLTRFAAFLVDLFIISIIYGTLITIVTGNVKNLFSRFGTSTGNILIDLCIGLVVFLIYSVLLQWKWNGQTLGMRAIGLKLVDEKNQSVSFTKVVIRNVIFLITTIFSLGITIIVNYLLLVFTVKERTIQDILSKTQIITPMTK